MNGIGLLLLLPLAAQAGVALLAEPAEIDFGEVFEHEVTSRELKLINIGNEPVSIARVGRTCPDCLATELDRNLLVPGEGATLAVTLCPDQPPGRLEELVTVESPEAGNLGIPVRASLRPSYRILGAPFLSEALSPGMALTIRVLVTPQVPMRGELIPPAEPHPMFDVSIAPAPFQSNTYAVTLTCTNRIPEGLTDVAIDLPSTDPADPPCTIYGSVFLPPPIHVYPARLRVADSDAEQLRILFMDQLRVPNRERPARLLDVRVPDPDIRAEVHVSNLVQLRVNLYIRNREGQRGPVGDIVLVTDRPDRPEIRVPLIVDPGMDTPRWAPGEWVVPVANPQGCGCGATR